MDAASFNYTIRDFIKLQLCVVGALRNHYFRLFHSIHFPYSISTYIDLQLFFETASFFLLFSHSSACILLHTKKSPVLSELLSFKSIKCTYCPGRGFKQLESIVCWSNFMFAHTWSRHFNGAKTFNFFSPVSQQIQWVFWCFTILWNVFITEEA